MKSKQNKPGDEAARPQQEKVAIRKDLQDASKGRDLSYLNEMPQRGRDEGVKAGIPPKKNGGQAQSMADES